FPGFIVFKEGILCERMGVGQADSLPASRDWPFHERRTYMLARRGAGSPAWQSCRRAIIEIISISSDWCGGPHAFQRSAHAEAAGCILPTIGNLSVCMTKRLKQGSVHVYKSC